MADQYIAEHAATGDLVVTQDIPLAALLVPREVAVLDPEGRSIRRKRSVSASRFAITWRPCGWQVRSRRAHRPTMLEPGMLCGRAGSRAYSTDSPIAGG